MCDVDILMLMLFVVVDGAGVVAGVVVDVVVVEMCFCVYCASHRSKINNMHLYNYKNKYLRVYYYYYYHTITTTPSLLLLLLLLTSSSSTSHFLKTISH